MSELIRIIALGTALALWCLVSVPIGGQHSPSPGSEIPIRVESVDAAETTPLWIADELVTRTDAHGAKRVETALIPEIERLTIESYFETRAQIEAKQGRSPDGCTIYSDKPIVEDRNAKPRHTFVDYVRGARAVYRGRTAGVATGFYEGRPGSLLRIDLSRELFRDHNIAPLDTAFVYLNTGIVDFGDDAICLQDSSFPVLPPTNGTEVLLFVFFDADDETGTFFGLDAVEMIFFDPAAGLLAPERLKADLDLLSSKSIDDLEEIMAIELTATARSGLGP